MRAEIAAGARVAPPASLHELLARAEDLAGRTIAEVAQRTGRALPEQPARAKGYIGELVEHALGARAGSSPGPDFPELGVELKTLPLDQRGRPRESTFVCSAELSRLDAVEWPQSRVRQRLACVLFVPVEWRASLGFAQRRFGRPRLWRPSVEQERALRADWEALVAELLHGAPERLSARAGRHLQVRPKARDASVRVVAPDLDGAPRATSPRGFYLRASFTHEIFQPRES